MKLTEKWHVTGRSADFTLTELSVRKDSKTGAEKTHARQTYHPSLEQCLNKIIKSESLDLLIDDKTTIADFKDFLSNLKTDIKGIANAAQVTVPTDRESADENDPAGESPLL